jgi:hypothetical protein
MNIIKAIQDKHLFRPFLSDGNGKLASWRNWAVALRALYGLPISSKYASLIKQCTGRDYTLFPDGGFNTALFLTGRRSGKSRVSAIVGAYEAALSNNEKYLSKGELALVAIISPTTKQSRVVKNYLQAIFAETPLLSNEVIRETQWGFDLANKVSIEILTGDWRSVRGYSLLCCIIDELCFFGLDVESKVRSDTELIRAIQPSLATTNGKLICISSPYAKKGWGYKQYQKNFGNDQGSILVWNCPSRVMNPLLPQSVVDEAMAEDLAAAKSEYGGEFRDDVVIFLPIEVIESVVKRGRKELMRDSSKTYFAFADLSGGRSDDAALAIGHREQSKVIIDCIEQYKPPFSPFKIVSLMGETLKKYKVRRCVGDNYSAEYTASAFRNNGINYEKCELPKSQLYLELLPRICSGGIELLDNERAIKQLASLERRTRSGGKDSIDHAPGLHDDLANVIAGCSYTTSKGRYRIGAF